MTAMKKFSSGVALAALIGLGALVAVAPQTVQGRAAIHALGVDTIVVPSPSPDPSPVAPTIGAASAPVVDPVANPAASPSPDATPAPVYPVAQGAPCLPPGVIDANGNCGVPDSSAAPVGGSAPAPPPAPPTANPIASQPGQGAPCLPPGVLVGTACQVPEPSPSPAPVPSPVPSPTPGP